MLAGHLALTLILAAGGLLALYIYCQVIALLAMLATLPRLLAIALAIPLILLVAVIVMALIRLLSLYCRLRSNRQMRLSDIDLLERHSRMRYDCRRPETRKLTLKGRLQEYLREYPPYKDNGVRSGERQATVSADGDPPPPDRTRLFSPEELTRLKETRELLADPSSIQNPLKWIDVYTREFQPLLDRAANTRVEVCAKWVGWKTAISPNSLVDTLITLYWSFVLIRDLCVIYNLRVGVFGTTVLLGQVLFASYVAGKLNDLEEPSEQIVEQLMAGLPAIGRKIVGTLAVKAGAGLANYYMVRRLGKRAIGMLQPLATEPAAG